jgi:hypothetical protein
MPRSKVGAAGTAAQRAKGASAAATAVPGRSRLYSFRTAPVMGTKRTGSTRRSS